LLDADSHSSAARSLAQPEPPALTFLPFPLLLTPYLMASLPVQGPVAPNNRGGNGTAEPQAIGIAAYSYAGCADALQLHPRLRYSITPIAVSPENKVQIRVPAGRHEGLCFVRGRRSTMETSVLVSLHHISAIAVVKQCYSVSSAKTRQIHVVQSPLLIPGTRVFWTWSYLLYKLLCFPI
jgi:hypothetical protein